MKSATTATTKNTDVTSATIATVAMLRLFKSVLIVGSTDENQPNKAESCVVSNSESLLAKTLPYGYFFSPDIPSEQVDETLIACINEVLGLSGEQANQAFHKSWQTIIKSDYKTLVMQQMVHYMTTYGFESLNVYNVDAVYIPLEALDVPERLLQDVDDDNQSLAITVIAGLTVEDTIQKIIELGSGIALTEQKLTDMMTVIEDLATQPSQNSLCVDADFIAKIANRELNTRLREYFAIVPQMPIEYLRYVIYQLTDESLLIKNRYLIEKIKQATPNKIKEMDALLIQAPADLATIFLRYKPLFLALKSVSSNKRLFNRLRKQAEKMHKPLPEDYLNCITRDIKQGQLDVTKLEKRLKNASIYRKIRLANALHYRLNLPQINSHGIFNNIVNKVKNRQAKNSIVYRVRNGRGWATEFNWNKKWNETTHNALAVVTNAIANELREHVAGKRFYIPDNVHYTLPATEKQFTGAFPTGSWVSVDNDMIVGIHWHNIEIKNSDGKFDTYSVEPDDFEQRRSIFRNAHLKTTPKKPKKHRVDLDLSMMSISGDKIGWNASYYDENKDIIFSGDMTNAPLPEGASELFYINNLNDTQALMVNYFNHSCTVPVPCKFLVADVSQKTSKKARKNDFNNYMVDPNDIIMQTSIDMSERQNMLGLIDDVNGQKRIYFANMNIGTSISSYGDEHTRHAQRYLINSNRHSLMLRDILQQAGAIVVDSLSGNDVREDSLIKSGLIKDSLQEDDMLDAESQTTEIIDLSPNAVNKATFVALMQG